MVENFLLYHLAGAKNRSYEMMVKWQGLEDIENSWEPLETLMKDVGVQATKYVMGIRDDAFIRKMLQLR